MSVNTSTTEASFYKSVLPFNNGTMLLNKSEFQDCIINICNTTCPTETYSFLELNGTVHKNDFISVTNDGIAVDTSTAQFQEIMIRGNYS